MHERWGLVGTVHCESTHRVFPLREYRSLGRVLATACSAKQQLEDLMGDDFVDRFITDAEGFLMDLTCVRQHCLP